MEQAKLVKGRFIGDPSFEFEHSEKKDNQEEEMVCMLSFIVIILYIN